MIRSTVKMRLARKGTYSIRTAGAGQCGKKATLYGTNACSLQLADHSSPACLPLVVCQEMLNSIRRTFIAREQRIRTGIIDKRFCARIPGYRASQLHGDPADDAGGPAAMGDPRRSDGLLARADAVEPVLVVLRAAWQLHLQTLWREQALVTGIQRRQRRT